jgi:dTDP-4-dehydrorhamnose 3,5-epimerase
VDTVSIEGAWTYTPQAPGDDRGSFVETFRGAEFAAALGCELTAGQVNRSVSRREVSRGIHYADVPPGQGKYVTCAGGRGA